MTETNMENAPGGEGGQAANPVTSTTGGQSPSAIDVKNIAEALRPIIAEEVSRSTQSVKDKRIAKLQGDVDKALARYDELLKEGLTPARARRELALDQLLEAQSSADGSVVPASPVTGTHQTQAVFDHTALLATLGLDPNSPEVLGVVREGGDAASQVLKYANLAASKVKTQTAPNPAQQVPIGGGSSASVTTDALMKEYQELTKNIPVGQTGIQARFEAQLAIRKKAREAGVPEPI